MQGPQHVLMPVPAHLIVFLLAAGGLGQAVCPVQSPLVAVSFHPVVCSNGSWCISNAASWIHEGMRPKCLAYPTPSCRRGTIYVEPIILRIIAWLSSRGRRWWRT